MTKYNQKFPESDESTAVQKTKTWLKDFVIGLNLCPFAHRPYSRDIIRYSLSPFINVDEFVVGFYFELQKLARTPKNKLSTTLMIIEQGLEDFEYYLDILETCEDVLAHSEYKDVFQIASFHPEYYFAQTEKDDVTNFTNRSPFPMIHIIRTEEVEEAIKSFDHPEDIPLRNKALMIKMGSAEILKKMHGLN